jgi:hypothetical protein
MAAWKWLLIIGGAVVVLAVIAVTLLFNYMRERDYDISSDFGPLLKSERALQRLQVLVKVPDGMALTDPQPAWADAPVVPAGTPITLHRVTLHFMPLPGILRLRVFGEVSAPGSGPVAFQYSWAPVKGYMDPAGGSSELIRAPWQTESEPTVLYSIPKAVLEAMP